MQRGRQKDVNHSLKLRYQVILHDCYPELYLWRITYDIYLQDARPSMIIQGETSFAFHATPSVKSLVTLSSGLRSAASPLVLFYPAGPSWKLASFLFLAAADSRHSSHLPLHLPSYVPALALTLPLYGCSDSPESQGAKDTPPSHSEPYRHSPPPPPLGASRS